MRTSPPPQLPIFRSHLQAQILALLLGGAAPSLGVPDLSERLSASRASVYRELQRLVGAGILERNRVGRNTLYSAADESPLVEPLRTLVDRTLGVEPELRRRLSAISGIEAAAVFGSFAAGRMRGSSDIDLLVIGTPDRDVLEREIRSVEDVAGRDINLTSYASDEWRERVRSGAGFASTVLSRPTIELIGEIPREDG